MSNQMRTMNVEFADTTPPQHIASLKAILSIAAAETIPAARITAYAGGVQIDYPINSNTPPSENVKWSFGVAFAEAFTAAYKGDGGSKVNQANLKILEADENEFPVAISLPERG